MHTIVRFAMPRSVMRGRLGAPVGLVVLMIALLAEPTLSMAANLQKDESTGVHRTLGKDASKKQINDYFSESLSSGR